MGKRDEKNYGNVYEIQLLNGKYAYTCWIGECSFGIFNYIFDYIRKSASFAYARNHEYIEVKIYMDET